MAILKDARAVELAHAFINFMHEPDVAAANTDYVWYLAPNTAAYPLMSDEVRENPSIVLSDELVAKSEVIRDLGADNAKYVKVWDEVKAAR